MSAQSFVNALIGLCRDHQRGAVRRRGSGITHRHVKPVSAQVVEDMLERGYFRPEEAQVFGDALEMLLQSTDPKRKKDE